MTTQHVFLWKRLLTTLESLYLEGGLNLLGCSVKDALLKPSLLWVLSAEITAQAMGALEVIMGSSLVKAALVDLLKTRYAFHQESVSLSVNPVIDQRFEQHKVWVLLCADRE